MTAALPELPAERDHMTPMPSLHTHWPESCHATSSKASWETEFLDTPQFEVNEGEENCID